MDILKGYAARGMDRSWTELQRTIGVGLNAILLGKEPTDAGLTKIADQMYTQAQRAGYKPQKTAPKP
jgi:hypothetical protein